MAAKAGFYGLVLSAALVVTGGMPGGGATAQDEPAVQSTSQEQSGSAAAGKSDLDQSALRGAAVDQAPRPTLTSTQGASLPKILSDYR